MGVLLPENKPTALPLETEAVSQKWCENDMSLAYPAAATEPIRWARAECFQDLTKGEL